MDNERKEYLSLLFTNLAESVFSPKLLVKFRINDNDQVILDAECESKNLCLKNRTTSVVLSNTLFNDIEKAKNDFSKQQVSVLKFLGEIFKGNKWKNYIVAEVKISKEIEEQALEFMKEHILGVGELYTDSIVEQIENSKIDKSYLLSFWSKYVSKQNDVVKDILTFYNYSNIKRIEEFPEVKLMHTTGYMTLKGNSDPRFFKVEVNKDEMNRIRETEKILPKALKEAKLVKEIEDVANNILSSFLEEILNTEKCLAYKNTYDCEAALRRKSNLDFNFNSSTMKVNSIVFSIYDDIDKIKNAISQGYKKDYEVVMTRLDDAIMREKSIASDTELLEVLKVIKDSPKKGITTYVDILAGSDSPKMRNYDYNKLSSYGKFSDYTKKYITDKISLAIENNLVLKANFRASFGSYTGLVLSDKAKDSLKAIKDNGNDDLVNELKIESFKDFRKEVEKASTESGFRLALLNMKNNLKDFTKEDVNEMIDFIINDRVMYRKYEDVFVSLISGIVPSIYKSIYLLNANMSSGVTQKTFLNIYEKIN